MNTGFGVASKLASSAFASWVPSLTESLGLERTSTDWQLRCPEMKDTKAGTLQGSKSCAARSKVSLNASTCQKWSWVLSPGSAPFPRRSSTAGSPNGSPAGSFGGIFGWAGAPSLNLLSLLLSAGSPRHMYANWRRASRRMSWSLVMKNSSMSQLSMVGNLAPPPSEGSSHTHTLRTTKSHSANKAFSSAVTGRQLSRGALRSPSCFSLNGWLDAVAWAWNSSTHPSPAALNHTRGPIRRGEFGGRTTGEFASLVKGGGLASGLNKGGASGRNTERFTVLRLPFKTRTFDGPTESKNAAVTFSPQVWPPPASPLPSASSVCVSLFTKPFRRGASTRTCSISHEPWLVGSKSMSFRNFASFAKFAGLKRYSA
mmetsp:Transcript_82615/g.165105  ORF Transcript_82615/g.165105 Transcript_82615/m.165105 type:complete len:371 (-) Transcript_82615:108-1220(-)